jgi:hypothetical protein
MTQRRVLFHDRSAWPRTGSIVDLRLKQTIFAFRLLPIYYTHKQINN